MLSVNNLIFDSTAAADGAWRKIDNWIALSIHIIGLEGDVWVEVSNNPACDINTTTSAATAGVPLIGNLVTLSPPTDDELSVAYSGDGLQAMISPSCLVWQYIRVRKTGGGIVETKAYLFGQVG